MFIKFVPYLHQKSANQALNMVLFILWCWFRLLNSSQIAPLDRRCNSGTNLFDYNAKFVLNIMQIYVKYHQIRCHKGAGTKMHNSLFR